MAPDTTVQQQHRSTPPGTNIASRATNSLAPTARVAHATRKQAFPSHLQGHGLTQLNTSPVSGTGMQVITRAVHLNQWFTQTKPQRPTVHVVSQCSLQLSQRAAPGTELQQPQRQGDAHWRHDQVGVVLCLSESLVEADGKPAVQLLHALLEAAVAVTSLRQPEANEK